MGNTCSGNEVIESFGCCQGNTVGEEVNTAGDTMVGRNSFQQQRGGLSDEITLQKNRASNLQTLKQNP